GFIAEGETVWMRFKVAGSHGGELYGLPPTGRPVEGPEIGIMRFADGKWKDAWDFAAELGLLLQLRALPMLQTQSEMPLLRNRHLALIYRCRMIFSENRYPLFGIMR